jgi:hypothetical protein
MALAEDVEEIWEPENITLDAVLGMMSFSSWLESIETGCNTHVSSLEFPLVRFSLKAPDTSTAAILVHRFILSFLGGPIMQYGDLPNGETDCRVSGSSIMSLFVAHQSWIMSVNSIFQFFLYTNKCPSKRTWVYWTRNWGWSPASCY